MTIDSFIADMQSNGIVLKDNLIPDGIIHRFINTRKSKKDGWYVAFDDGSFGAYGDWFLGNKYTFANGKGELSEAERQKINLEIERAKQKRLEEQKEVAEQALNTIESLKLENNNSEYLLKKQVKSYNVFWDKTHLVIPVRDIDGKIWSLQYIYNDNTKRFLKGGRKKGCFFAIGKFPSDEIIICEGYATGASIYEATGITTIIAFDAYNIPEVASQLKAEKIVIACDNDNVGIEQANKTGLSIICPKQEKYDFNDVHCEFGLRAVKEYFLKEDANYTYPHGLVGDIAKWISETAYISQPVLSIAAALVAVSTIKAHRLQTISGTRTNLYVLGLAPSGAGKQHPLDCIDIIFSEYSALQKAILGKIPSGAGLIDGLHMAEGRALLPIDEAGRMLSAVMSSKAGVFQREIVDIIIELFQKTKTIYRGKQYALSKENKHRRDIEHPCLSIIGMTVPEKLYDNLQSTDIIDGFLNRWLVFETKDNGSLKDGKANLQIPVYIKAKIQDILKTSVDCDFPDTLYPEKINPKIVEFTDEAKEYFDFVKQEINEITEPLRINKDPLLLMWIRAVDHIRKVALIVCDNQYIRIDDIKWARNTVFLCLKQACDNCAGISDNQNEQELLKILKIIKDNKIISKSDLTRKTQFLTPRRRNEILEDLITAERIIIGEKDTATKKKTFYKFQK